MIVQVIVFVATVALGSLAEASTQPLNVEMTAEVRAEFDKLSRYCGSNYGYSYNSYRPSSGSYYNGGSSSGSGLANLLQPALLGLAAGGGAAVLGNLISGLGK